MLRIPEIWRYDGTTMQFYELADDQYREVSESGSFPGLRAGIIAAALEKSKTDGQDVALDWFRAFI